MRNALIAAIAVTLPSLAATAATTAVVNGNGAFVAFSQVSDDGCVVTTGQLVLLNNNAGDDRPDGVLAVANQIDTCDPEDFGNGYYGLAAVPYSASGLSSADTAGTVVLTGFGGGELTFELDLAWTGHGAITTDPTRFHAENTFDFQASQSRAADLDGWLDIDGAPAELHDALLIRGVAGSILR